MKKIMILPLLLCFFWGLWHAGLSQNNATGTPVPSRQLHKNILLVPLDGRPPCKQFVIDSGAIAGFNVTTPPSELQDYYSAPGDTAGMRKWLQENTPHNQAALISIDQLLYGGLLAAREKEATPSQQDDLVNFLRQLHAGELDIPTISTGNILRAAVASGSELGRKAEKQTNGGLIYMTGGALNITTGATLRNNANKDYGDGNWGRGGAIYLQGGTVNVNAGLFSNLHARRGGAIAATGGTLNITGTNGSTRFENCDSNGEDGGAIDFHVNAALTIDGGESKTNPGILFTGCKALTNAGDGGAIYADTSYNYVVTVKGCAFTECSAKVQVSGSTEGNGGGAISAWHVKGIDASYCSFYSCDTMTGGGAIAAYVKTSTTAGNKAVFVSYCTFDSCNCRAQGGAISAYQDDNGATASKTKLYINDSSFSDCSSGTNNSSGGAIQCYLPCMEFVGTSFSDCWAGKEGGAVNNFFGGNYTQQWANSSMVMTNCRFIRCRAEDRYDTTAVQHYGGGVNTKAKTVTVTGSYFEDCVSTLKEGGALHIGGQDAGSKATITGSTFKNCTAKNGGGALLSSHETLEINNCYFYGCSSAASNGGAVYNTANSRGGSTQKTFTITDCVFSADPEASDSEACSAVNGGSIWTRAQSVTIKDCTINGSVAGGNGGAICLSKNGSQSATITDSEIKNSRAVKGSAVYVDDTATFSGVSITGNTCSDINSGAIQGGKLYFEGNTVVKGNPCSSDEKYMHDASAYMCRTVNSTIGAPRVRRSAPGPKKTTCWKASSTTVTTVCLAIRRPVRIRKSIGDATSARSRTRTATPSSAPTAGTRSTRS